MSSPDEPQETIQLLTVRKLETEPGSKTQASSSSVGLTSAGPSSRRDYSKSSEEVEAKDSSGEQGVSSESSQSSKEIRPDSRRLIRVGRNAQDNHTWCAKRWEKLSQFEKCLMVSFCVVTIISLCVNLPIGIYCTNKLQKYKVHYSDGTNISMPNELDKNPYTICETGQCKFAAASMKYDMDSFVNPCEDFYEFACGRFIQINNYNPSVKQTSRVKEVQDRVSAEIYSLLVQKQSRVFSKTFNHAIKSYGKCMEIKKRQVLAEIPTLQLNLIISDLVGFQWPVYTKDWRFEHPNREKMDVFTDIMANFIKFKIPALIDIDVDATEKNNSQNILKVKPQKLSKFVIRASKIYRNNDGQITPLEDARFMGFMRYFATVVLMVNRSMEADDMSEDISNVLEFEWSMAGKAITVKNSTDNSKKTMTIEDLEIKIGPLAKGHITKMVNKILPNGIKVNKRTLVEATGIQYLKMLFEKLNKISPRTLINYFAFLVVNEYGQYVDEHFKSALDWYRILSKKLTPETFLNDLEANRKPVARSNDCVGLVHNMFKYAITGEYVLKYDKIKSKESLTAIFNTIKDSYAESLMKNTMLKGMTNYAVEKIKDVVGFIAYPRWVLSNIEVDKYYEDMLESLDGKKPFVYDALAYNRFEMSKIFEQLFVAGNRSRWDDIRFESPLRSTAVYYPRMNVVSINVGLLSQPFYDEGSQKYILFGSIGFVIAHELTHAFETKALKYDGYGNLKNEWKADLTEFSSRIKCLNETYEKVIDKRTELHIFSNRKFKEDVADNGGLRQSYFAYRKWVEENGEEDRLPYDLDTFTPEQDFFIFMAQAWCSKDSDFALRMKIYLDTYSPKRYRVNLPMSMFDEFAKTFNCPVNSTMNPRRKCVIW